MKFFTRLPSSRAVFLLLGNLIWLSLPVGFAIQFVAREFDPRVVVSSDGNSVAIVLIPFFLLVLALMLPLNLVLAWLTRRYAGAISFWTWDRTRPSRSRGWSLLCALFIGLYLLLAGESVVWDWRHEGPWTPAFYVGLALWVWYSLALRAACVAPARPLSAA